MSDGPIYWHPGLFLQPQHFQILQRQLSAALGPLLAHITPYFWGVADLAVNAAALAAGRLELSAIRLVFPTTAEMIAFPGNAVCAGRQLAKEAIPVDGALKAYVGLRAVKPDQPNVTVAETLDQMALAPTRLAVPVAPETVADIYGKGPAAQVRRMAYVLSLVFENELDQAGDMDLIPVARLTREGDRINIDPNFVPPSLTVAAAPVLSAMLRAVRDRVLGRARQLEGYKNLSAKGAASSDFTLLLMGLRTLSRFAARLDHAAAAPCLSPWEAYGLLRELVAELSVFSLNISLLGEDWQEKKRVPDYSHTDLGACFRAACDVIEHLLEGLSAGPRFVTRFAFSDPYWSAQLPPQIMTETKASGGDFWLVLHSEKMAPEVMGASAGRLLKLAPPAGMESLLVRALPGLPLAPSAGPPPGLPRMQGAIYFHIDRESPLWAEVEKDGKLCLHWSGAPDDLDAQLAVLGR
ncbi:MAG: type VI secretion system baseplate subunit TssK [Desulfobacterales bacterium]|nr:type VI secretion system baseplate subunit TssK [Desulfobacterales bacterium]